MAYRVRIEGSNAIFKFVEVNDALNFESMAAEYGSIEDYHYETAEDGTHVRVSDGWRPVICTFSKEEDEEETPICGDGEEVVV